MSAETLRRAAALMRERADAAIPGFWDAETFTNGHDLVAPDAEHIASWSPAVALAVADWLDKEADGFHLIGDATRVAIEIKGTVTLEHSTHLEALAVARAYLRESE